MAVLVTIANGFAEVGAGAWLMGHAQPAAFFGDVVRRRRRGWRVPDRGRLELVETTAAAKCSTVSRPFLTHIPCAEPVFAVSEKVLVAPAEAWAGAQTVRPVPMSVRSAICVTEFRQEWLVLATAGRTVRIQVSDGDTLSTRIEAVVAWTGNRPTGYCPKLGILDILLPRGPKDLLLHFHGPCLVWVEGTGGSRSCVTGRMAGRGIFGAPYGRAC